MAETTLKKHTVTAETLKNLLFKSAVVYKNFEINETGYTGSTMGATKGGIEYNHEQEYGEVELDGAMVSVKGGQIKFGESCEVSMNVTEFTEGVVVDAMHLVLDDEYDGTRFNKYKTKSTLTDDDYLENIAVVGTLTSDKDIIMVIENPICLGALQLQTEDKKQATYKINYKCTASVEQTDLNHLPIYYYFPKEETTPTNQSLDGEELEETPTV